jgi:hypothetical protein
MRRAPTERQARELFTERSCLLALDPYLFQGRPNTLRGRRTDWALFCGFCEQRSRIAMPASEDTVVAFLEEISVTPPLRGGRPRRDVVSAAALARRARRARVPGTIRLPGCPRGCAHDATHAASQYALPAVIVIGFHYGSSIMVIP